MKSYGLLAVAVFAALVLTAWTGRSADSFETMFSIPREPATSLGPGQCRSLEVPAGNKVVVTDVYIENLGGGSSHLQLSEQSGPNSFEVRYAFNTDTSEKTIVNYTTGLRFGDESPIEGSIRICNDHHSQAGVLARVNGIIMP